MNDGQSEERDCADAEELEDADERVVPGQFQREADDHVAGDGDARDGQCAAVEPSGLESDENSRQVRGSMGMSYRDKGWTGFDSVMVKSQI